MLVQMVLLLFLILHNNKTITGYGIQPILDMNPLTFTDISADLETIEFYLSSFTDDMTHKCIGCQPIIEAQLKLRELKRKLENETLPID